MEHKMHNPMYDNIGLYPVENGFRLTYTVKTKRPGDGKMDDMHYENKEEVFTDEQTNNAIDRMLELIGRKKTKKEKENQT